MYDAYILVAIALISIIYSFTRPIEYPFIIVALAVLVYTLWRNTRYIEQFDVKPVSEYDPSKQAPIDAILPERSSFSMLVNTLGFEQINATDSLRPSSDGKLELTSSKNGPPSNKVETNNGTFTIVWTCKAQSLTEGENSFMKIYGSLGDGYPPNAIEIRYLKNSNGPNGIRILYSNATAPFEYTHEILNHTSKYHSFVLTIDSEQEQIKLSVDKIPLGEKDISDMPTPDISTMSDPIKINKDAAFTINVKLIGIFNGRILPNEFFTWYDKYKTSRSQIYQDLYKRSENNYTTFVNEFKCPFPQEVCEKCSNIINEQWADQLKVIRNANRECLRAIYCHCQNNSSQECQKWKRDNLRKIVQKDLGFQIPENAQSWFDTITCETDDKKRSWDDIFSSYIPNDSKPFVCYYDPYNENYKCYYWDGSRAYPDWQKQQQPKPADKPYTNNQKSLDLTPNQDVSVPSNTGLKSLTDSSNIGTSYGASEDTSQGASKKTNTSGQSASQKTTEGNIDTRAPAENKSKKDGTISPEEYKQMISDYRNEESSNKGFFSWLFGV